MAVGIAVANAILLVTFAERSRITEFEEHSGPAVEITRPDAVPAAIDGAAGRLRPILMTSLAMMAGMLPMALGLGDGGEQTAPLGRAVVGGLFAATVATLIVVPCVFASVQGRRPVRMVSLPVTVGRARYAVQVAMSLDDAYVALRAGRWLFLSIVVLFLGGAFLVTALLPKTYSSTVILSVRLLPQLEAVGGSSILLLPVERMLS